MTVSVLWESGCVADWPCRPSGYATISGAYDSLHFFGKREKLFLYYRYQILYLKTFIPNISLHILTHAFKNISADKIHFFVTVSHEKAFYVTVSPLNPDHQLKARKNNHALAREMRIKFSLWTRTTWEKVTGGMHGQSVPWPSLGFKRLAVVLTKEKFNLKIFLCRLP